MTYVLTDHPAQHRKPSNVCDLRLKEIDLFFYTHRRVEQLHLEVALDDLEIVANNENDLKKDHYR